MVPQPLLHHERVFGEGPSRVGDANGLLTLVGEVGNIPKYFLPATSTGA